MSKLVLIVVVVLTITAAGATASALITGQDVKNGSLTSKDVKDGTLRASDLKDGLPAGGPGATGPAGPAGATGPGGATGPAGPIELTYVRGGEEGAPVAAHVGPDEKGEVEKSCPQGSYPLSGTLQIEGENPVVPTRVSGPTTESGVPVGWMFQFANDGSDPIDVSILVICASATNSPTLPRELAPVQGF